MIGHINYGGRVTDNWDRITLLTMLKKCISPDLIASDKYFYSDN
jgi:dynein heavy chain